MPRGKFTDLTGREFGRLLVLGRADDYVSPLGQRQPQWRVWCVCEEETVVMGSRLRSGKTRSCGCLRDEALAETRSLRRAW